jgi:hypothetical protein
MTIRGKPRGIKPIEIKEDYKLSAVSEHYMANELNEIIKAHGGLTYWQSLKSIELELSANGFLFTAKRRQPLNHIRMTIKTERPEVTTHDWPVRGQNSIFYGEDLIEIRNISGNILQSRKNPREMFKRFRRFFYWDDLDFAFFSSYAMWNYMTIPFLLLNPGVEVNAASDSEFDGLKKITAKFPKGFPTHCESQDFYFDKEWHLRRHDYTAEVVGSWAKAAHLTDSYKQFSGLSLPTRRRVYPKILSNKPLPVLTLVAIDIHSVKPLNA